MELFGEIRQKTGIWILERKGSRTKRNVQYSNIESIKKIGIVWDASNSEEFGILSKFYYKMNEKDINVKIIGYYPGRELPNNLTAIKFLSCIRKSELDFFYKPILSAEAATFIKTRFDVLIDINFDKKFPLYYVSTLSTANFKVGLWDSKTKNPIFDLMIELKRPIRVDNYLEHVMHYLEMIRCGSQETQEK